MKNRGIINKISAVFLVVAMMVTLLPSFSTPVFAQETKATELPIEQFATAEQLKSFNTDDTNDKIKNAAKVYFGNNNQQWWIAGSQHEQGLTLFAASPLVTNQQFEPNCNENKKYDASWNCTYSNGNPSEVFQNHYGASPLRNTLKGLETSYFTSEEQTLMNLTTIYTDDWKNNTVYSTTDKLYLAYGLWATELIDHHITVGTNSIKSLNSALLIDKDYWGSNTFWLRAPTQRTDDYSQKLVHVMMRDSMQYLTTVSVGGVHALQPAFELNLSTVLFASAAPAAALSDLSFQNTAAEGAFTLRYDASKNNKNLGSAEVSFDKSKITLTDVPSGTYLVAQNSNWATAKIITNETEVTSYDMGLPSFENCKVWLETTDKENRMTYATLAIELGVAEVDGVQFKTLQDAIDNCPENGVVKLLDNVTITGAMISKKCTLDLNNYTITVNNPEWTGIVVNNALTIITGKEGNIISEHSAAISNNGTLKVQGKIDCQIRNIKDIIDGNFGGEILNTGNIIGGSFANVENKDNGTINGGNFSGYFKNYSAGIINGGYFDKNSTFICSGIINEGSFYSDVTLDGGTAVINGGSFAHEPELINDAKYGKGKVLLKTSNTELPYKVIDEASIVTLNITIGDNLTVESGNLQQTIEKNTEIQPITIIVDDAYYLDDEYVSYLQAKGLSVNKEGNKFTISGSLKDSLTITIDATKKEDGNSVVGKPTVSDIAYKEGLTLNDLKLPEGWVWANPDTRLSAGTYLYTATFDTAIFENTTDFSNVEGYDFNGHRVVRDIKVNIKKGNSSDIVVPEITEKTDIENLEIKIGDVVLVEGKDYTVSKKQDGDTVSVVIEFIGNYTGKVTKTYKVTPDNVDTNDNVNTDTTTNTNNSVTVPSTYDDGGPFTTDECGSVYDRWGNLMWKAPSCKAQVSDGYSIVNTGDR